MEFDLVTIFPELFAPFLELGVLGRAVADGRLSINVVDLKQYADNRWGKVDDEPYGGGAGMVFTAPPVLAAVRELLAQSSAVTRVLVTSPRGRVFSHQLACELVTTQRLIVLCGRYEGIDERVLELVGAEEVSLGDFVLGGGEVAAMAMIEAVARLIPGVVGDPASVEADSFADGLLDYPCYTRPATVEGSAVPTVLLSGNHEEIRRWRLERSVTLTVQRRPDLVCEHWQRYPEAVRRLVSDKAPGLARRCERQVDKARGERDEEERS